MSLTITVPDSVPSLLQSSMPWVPSSARNSRWSLVAVIMAQSPLSNDPDAGKPLELPGLMSLTITVPDSVPSLLHSSLPLVPSSPEK